MDAVYLAVARSGTVFVYDISRSRIVLEVTYSASPTSTLGYISYKYDYSGVELQYHSSGCSPEDGVTELINTADTNPDYYLWEGDPWCESYVGADQKFHMAQSCSECPTGAVTRILNPLSFKLSLDNWCKLCSQGVYVPRPDKLLSPSWD